MKKLALALAVVSAALLAGCPSGGGSGTGDDDDDAASGLGCRDVTISSGVDGNAAGDSVYYTSFIDGTDFSEFLGAGGFADETLTLCAGVLSSDGQATLTLEADATEAISLPANNCLCRQFLASGSSGTLYCSASADTLDFTSTQDSMGAGAAAQETLVEGPGAVSGEGHVRITFSAKTTGIDANPASCTVAACTAALVGVTAEDVLYTTGTASSEFTNTTQGGTKTATATGHPFDDDPSDGTADCEDWRTASGTGALAGAPEHDEDNPDAGPGDVVTVERIAEAP